MMTMTKKEALLKIEKSEAWNEETTCVKILNGNYDTKSCKSCKKSIVLVEKILIAAKVKIGMFFYTLYMYKNNQQFLTPPSY